MRADQRAFNELRKIVITPHVCEYAEGSVMIEFGKTKVLCTASLDDQMPKWLHGSGKGWITAEYGMIPRSTQNRIKRDKSSNSGRTQEISRLIGRSLRSAVNLQQLGEKQLIIDCDVILADGGTRTASVTGGFVALALALKKLHKFQEIKSIPLINYVAAVSVGLKDRIPHLDLDYNEDSSIGTDMNFVMTQKNEFIELQGTAEQAPFNQRDLSGMLELATKGCQELFVHQEKIIGEFFPLKLESI